MNSLSVPMPASLLMQTEDSTQSIKKLKGHRKEFCLDPSGWKMYGKDKVYNLNDLDEESDVDPAVSTVGLPAPGA